MASNNPNQGISSEGTVLSPAASSLMRELIAVAMRTANAQFDAFAARLTEALLKISELSQDSKEANLSFNAAQLLKKNSYAFYYVTSEHLEKTLLQELEKLEHPVKQERLKTDDLLGLVPYEEMDKKLMLSNVARAFESDITDRLVSLGIRIAHLMGRSELSAAQNPFRTESFLSAINAAWAEFDPDPESHYLLLPALRPNVFLDLPAILQTLNETLIARGILPELTDSYRIKKSNSQKNSNKSEDPNNEAVIQQLTKLFAPEAGSATTNQGTGTSSGNGNGNAGMMPGNLQNQVLQATAASNQLLGYLAGVQRNSFDHYLAGSFSPDQQGTSLLLNIKNQAPQGALSKIDEKTIDLLTKVFDVVFHNQNIPSEIKSLMGFLQVPVLKAALLDKDFFFKEEHPARRLIDLLTKSSMGWDQKQGENDPLYQTIKRNVQRVQEEFDQQVTVFSDVVSDIETFIKEEDAVSTHALATPITQALRQEKLVLATKSAKSDVSMRIGTGEVVAFVESFLEKKWVPVLTLAYGIKEEKPEALESALKTMDDLVWSVKPKITLSDRKELITKLPSMLAALNKWLNVVKLDDAERLQFFAELAECHASIVRAPLEMSPQRQLEIAMESAKKAAERRIEIRSKQQPEPVADTFAEKVQTLERGTWLEFTQKDGTVKAMKLAWVSPLRNLFIFSSRDKLESFSMPVEDLMEALRENRASVVITGGLVGRALAEALGANDAVMTEKSAA